MPDAVSGASRTSGMMTVPEFGKRHVHVRHSPRFNVGLWTVPDRRTIYKVTCDLCPNWWLVCAGGDSHNRAMTAAQRHATDETWDAHLLTTTNTAR